MVSVGWFCLTFIFVGLNAILANTVNLHQEILQEIKEFHLRRLSVAWDL